MRFADEVIRERRKKKAEVVAGVHQARTHLAPLFRPLFGDERAAHGPLATDADAGQQTADGYLPDGLPEPGEEA